MKFRARCPSIFSLIAIELNVPRDDFSSSDRTNFCHLGTRFQKSRFSPLWYLCAYGQGRFKSEYIMLVVLQLCLIFTIGESPCVCSKYITFYWFEAGQKLVRRDRTTLDRSWSNYFYRTDNANCADFLVRSRSNYFAHGRHALKSIISYNSTIYRLKFLRSNIPSKLTFLCGFYSTSVGGAKAGDPREKNKNKKKKKKHTWPPANTCVSSKGDAKSNHSDNIL